VVARLADPGSLLDAMFATGSPTPPYKTGNESPGLTGIEKENWLVC
jgi:hypothetical protein